MTGPMVTLSTAARRSLTRPGLETDMPRSVVVPLDRELDHLVATASAAAGMDVAEFALAALRQHSAAVLGARMQEQRRRSGQNATVRPVPTLVLRIVARVFNVSVQALVGPSQARHTAQARATAAYLLREDAGLTSTEIARLTGRTSETIRHLTAGVQRAIARGGPHADRLRRCRDALTKGQAMSQQPDTQAWSPDKRSFLPALAAYRHALGLTQPELARRAGLPRETVARLEGVKRRATPATARALATALGVPPGALAGVD